MEGLRSVFGGVASGETEVEPVRDGDGLLGSGIDVPDTGAFGNMAKAIAAPMGEQLGDASVSATFEKAFTEGIVGVENALPQLGFKKRDYAVGFALFFIMNWEIANDVELDQSVSTAAGEKLVTAIQASGQGQDLPPEMRDAHYDMFLTVPVSVLAMVQGYEAQGQEAEAAAMREAAGNAFEQVIGLSPYDIDIDETGNIIGY